jgi:hypothetical protein
MPHGDIVVEPVEPAAGRVSRRRGWTTSDPPAEELNLGLLLFIPYRFLERRVFDAMAAAGFDDLTPAQARAFQRIARVVRG